MEKSPMNRSLFRSMMAAWTGFSQAISNTFYIDVDETYKPPSNDSNIMRRPNRLSQKGRRKRANWIR